MKLNEFDLNKSIKEDNNFSEFKPFKAENYFPNERHDYSKDFKVNESFENDIDIDSTKYSPNISNNKEQLKEIEKLTNNIQNIGKAITTHSSVILTSAVAVISASLVGVIPTINIFNNEAKILANSIINKPLVNQIVAEGKIIDVDFNYRYFVLIDQYINNELIEMDGICDLKINNNHFSFNTFAYYGITSYQYDIFYMKSEEENVLLYSSNKLDFTLDQSYSATYEKVSPKDAKYTFNDDGSITAHIETNFTSEFDYAYLYGINVLDSDGNIISNYIGNDKSIDLIIPSTGQIYFQYMDIGDFADDYHVYNNYMATDYSVIEIPLVTLSDDFDFDGEHFILFLNIDTIYDINSLSADLELTNQNQTVTKHIDNAIEKIRIVLDEFNGEIGELLVKGTFNFKDEMIDRYPHSINILSKTFDLSYKFDVTNVMVESYESKDQLPVTFNFDYLLPINYQINIKDDMDLINETMRLTNEYYLTKVNSGDGANLSVSILDNLGEVWNEPFSYHILSADEINNLNNEPLNYVKVNPEDSIVTYNDDGTINIYRNINFATNSSNIYYDAFIYSEENIDSVTGQKAYRNAYHNISNSKYSIIENVPEDNYYFYYYNVLLYDNIYYYTNMAMPRVGIDTNIKDNFICSANYDNENNQTSITITNTNFIPVSNECMIDNFTYELLTLDSTLSLTIEGNVIGKEITIFANKYLNNFDEFQADIPVKGNKYKAYNLAITN